MPKVCPIHLIPPDPLSPWVSAVSDCLEDKCAWWVHTQEITGCAVPVLAASRCDFALVRFLTLGEEKEQRDPSRPLKKRGSNG